jgi:hypothetical protein
LRPDFIKQIYSFRDLWGKGFDEPLFCIKNIKIKIEDIILLSSDKNPTLKISVNDISFIKFNMSLEEYGQLKPAQNGSIILDAVGRFQMNDWNGDIDTFVKLNKIDPEKMDNKSAIIQDMIINQGMSENVAEVMFKKQYGAAFLDGNDISDEEKEEKLVAEHLLLQRANEAKTSLSKWRVTETEKGNSNPQSIEEAQYKQLVETTWTKPVSGLISNLQELNLGLKYSLPDQTEVAEQLKFSVGEADGKKFLSEVLADPSDVGAKLVERFGVGDTPEAKLKSFVETLAFLQNKDAILKQVAEVAASKALSTHLKNVKPGDLGGDMKTVASSLNGKSKEELLIAAFNAAQKK